MGWLIALGVLILLAWLPLGVGLRYDDRGVRLVMRILKIPIPVYPGKEKPEKTPQPSEKTGETVEKTPENPGKPAEPVPKPAPAPAAPVEGEEKLPPKTPQPAEKSGEKTAPQRKEPPEKKAAKAPASKKEASGKKQAAPSGENASRGGSLRDFLPLIRVGLDLLDDFRQKLRMDRLELNLILAGGDPCDLAVNYGRAWAALGNLIPSLERYFVIKKRKLEVQCDFQAEELTLTARVEISITLGRALVLAVRYGIRGLREFLTLKKRRC